MSQFPEPDRRVFAYQAGGQELRADPLELHLRLTSALGNDANNVLRAARNRDEPATAAAARLRLIGAAREALGLFPFDPDTGQGATAAECERVLGAYLDFCGVQKKSTGTTPTSPTPSPPTPWTEPTPGFGSASG